MARIYLEFIECEHSGDLDNYENDVCSSGAKIIDRKININEEVGTLEIEVENKEAFWLKFQETESFEFLN